MESTLMSSLIAPTFAPESRNKNDSALAAEWWTKLVCTVHTVQCTVHYSTLQYSTPTSHTTVFLNTADSGSAVVIFTAFGFLGPKSVQLINHLTICKVMIYNLRTNKWYIIIIFFGSILSRVC